MSNSANSKLQKIPRQLPGCITTMKPEVGEYIPGMSLTMSFPVQEIFLNPKRSMQGGFIAAAFDNTFGALLHQEIKKNNMASIDMHLNYHRPIFENDRLTITAYLKAKGSTIASLYAEGFNEEGKLVATATTNMIILD